ncbi:MAG TPA: response regulator transcription factor [Thermoanaerobaculia bacterium]|nr:response regulator transcription factor [Thermoanaerobaculia bacterium]
MSAPVRVVLVDDHRVVRQALRTYLESFAGFEVSGEASSGEELLERVAGWRPDVVVVDLVMPGGMDGVQAAAGVAERSPATRVVVLSAHGDEARLAGALRAGACGYVRKDSAPEVFLAAVRGAARGQTVIDPGLAAALAGLAGGGPAADELTAREREVLRELARGRTNREIAADLGVTPETVKTHVASILAKLGLRHRTEAAVWALKTGLVVLEELELSSRAEL